MKNQWRRFKQREGGLKSVRGLCIAVVQYSSLCECALGLILCGFDIVEVDVQDREQVDSGEQVEARERARGIDPHGVWHHCARSLEGL